MKEVNTENMENILDWIGTKATKPISMFFKYDWKTNKVVRFDAGDFLYSDNPPNPNGIVVDEYYGAGDIVEGVSYGNHDVYKFTIKGNKSLDDINEFIMKHFAKYQQPIVCKI